MMKRNPLIGSDPELFAEDSKGITSVAGLLNCSKTNKLDMGDTRIQEDNVLVEFDIDPHDNFAGFNNNITRGIQLCADLIKEHSMEIAMGISSHIFTREQMLNFAKSAFEFGCEPDYNALTGQRNPKPAAADPGLRTGGGHLHFGFDHLGTYSTDNQKVLGVMCDYFLGLPAMMIDPDDRRRELYGKAGACRWKPYGIEYRTLSNFWIFDEVNRSFIYDQAIKAYNTTIESAFDRLVAIVPPEELQRVINENDKKMAEIYVRQLEVA